MDTMMDALQLHVLASLPQTYIVWLFVISFLRPLPDKFYRRLLILTVAHSVYTDIFILYIPTYLQLFNTLLAMGALIFIIFRELPLRSKIYILVGGIVCAISMDLITSGIAYLIGIQELDELRREHLFELLTILYPQLVILVILSWFVRKRFRLSSLSFLVSNNQERASIFKLIALIVIQFIALAAIEMVRFSSDANEQLVMSILTYFTIVISLAALVFMLRMLTRTRTEAIRTTQELYVEDINDMFTSVRGQRHDFLNHVQVIHTMAQMGKLEQLREYTSNLVQETREVSDIINHTTPALAAFAKAKTTVALGYGIAFSCELPEQWNVPDSAINMLDIIKILGNLVDNAFDESIRLPQGQRYVHVSIRAAHEEITIEVANRGRPIDGETRAIMFQAGYSTKGEGHSGLGLAIIQERVRHCCGTLDVECDPLKEITTFAIRLPYDRILAI